MEDDGYIELYKKYRPRVWGDLVGQDGVSRSLQKNLKTGEIPTAYGFFGGHGCGKTSAALLFAKSLNCEEPNGVDPCNECDTCVGIDDDTVMGVNVISMANKGLVKDAREIAERAWYGQPIKQQVWILDEAHNMSREAFDALLIPLEKDKMPSLFIFCSTAVNKIPDTILSRLQSRKFNPVNPKLLEEHISEIVAKEDLDVDEATIQNIVRLGRGSVRDTLKHLDEVVSGGESEYLQGGDLLEAISESSIHKVFETIAEASANGVDARDMAEGLLEDLRNLLLYTYKVDQSLIGLIPVEDVNKVAKGFVSRKGLIAAIDEIGEGLTKSTYGMDPRISLELSASRLVQKLSKAKQSKEKTE